VEAKRYLAALRRGWLLILAFGILGGVVGYAWSAAKAPYYRSTSSVFFQVAGADSVGSLLQGSNYAQSQVRSYAVLARMPVVLEDVIEELGLDTTPKALARQITTTIPLDTVIVEIEANAGDPAAARDLADSVARQLGSTVEGISGSAPGADQEAGTEARVSATIVEQASLPGFRSGPDNRRNALLGLLVGLTIGVAAAIARELLLHNRVADEDTLAEVTDLPLVGKIPAVGAKRPQRQPVPATNRAQVEAYRRAAANLDFINHSGNVRALVVSSASAGEGKTTLTVNLAFVLAENRRVLLIDADLRKPILTGRATFLEVVQPVGDRLDVIASGPVPPNPITMMRSSAFAELIETARGSYDYILLDCSPLLPVTDAAVLSNLTDGALLAVSSRTTRSQLTHAIEHLRFSGAPIHGIIMTMAKLTSGAYGYYGHETKGAPAASSRR
jgi:Mrp family chromosome partitioning ATPase